MTKSTLIELLQNIPGDPVIYTWDPDENDWCRVTGFTYDAQEVKLYTDDPEDEEDTHDPCPPGPGRAPDAATGGCLEEEKSMPEPHDHTQPVCPHCAQVFTRLGVWTDDQHLSAIFFCPQCGKAFGAQLLRSPTPEEGADAE